MLDILGLILGVGLVVTVLWSPILMIGRVRALFRRLPPTQSLIGSYVPVAIGLSLPFVIGSGIVITTTSTEGAAVSNALLQTVVVITLAYAVLLPTVAVIGLPRAGVDWDPTGYGIGTWLLLVGVSLWFAFIFAVPLALFAFVLALPTG